MNLRAHILSLILITAAVCAQAQLINTFAGTGITGYSGDGGPAVAAQFQEMVGIATDTAGNVYIADYNNNVIRKVTTDGVIHTIAGTGAPGYSGDGGPATAALLDHPWNVATDMPGNVYITEQVNHTVRKISTSGIITTIAGNGMAGYSGNGGPATAAALNLPWGLAFDNAGSIYISEGGNDVVRKIDEFGNISTIAGNGTLGYNGDGMPAVNAQLSNPAGLVWKGGELYIADNLNNRIRKINASGIISTVAGNGVVGYSGDGGPATSSVINSPQGICTDLSGNIIFSDFGNNVVRKITGTNISTIAGTGGYGFSGDDGSPLLATFAKPWGIATDKNNTVFIADKNNYRVRKIYMRTAAIGDVTTKTFSFYPNPAAETITIAAGEPINDLRIYDMAGRAVLILHNTDNKATADISGLEAGIYLIKINETPAGKFVKQ